MPNMSSQIKAHNAKILRSDVPKNKSITCNCRNKDLCPLEGNCLIDSVVYRAKVTSQDKPETNYIGMTQGPFKDREREHKNSLVNVKKKNSSILASYVWQEKESGKDAPNIDWSIIDRTPSFQNGDRKCRLCLAEKFHIIFQPFNKMNKRNEIVSKCRHENKFYFSNLKVGPVTCDVSDVNALRGSLNPGS